MFDKDSVDLGGIQRAMNSTDKERIEALEKRVRELERVVLELSLLLNQKR